MNKICTKNFLKIVLFVSLSFGQVKIGDWDAYTSPIKINNIINYGDSIICATRGGLLIKSQDHYNTLTTVDGIYRVDLSTVGKDFYGNIWIGGSSPNGFIQIYNLDQGSIDVFDYGFTEITHFYFDNDMVYVSFIDGQDVGFIKFVYSNDKWNYRDIYRNFPAQISEIKGFEILESTSGSKKTIFLATNVGLFLGDVSTNLKDPNNWKRDICCSNDSPIKAVTRYQNGFIFIFKLDAYTPSIIFIYPTQEFYSYSEIEIDFPVEFDHMIFDKDNFLWGIKNRSIYSQKTDYSPINHLDNMNSIVLDSYEQIIIGTDLGIQIIDENMRVTNFIPNSPASSKITAVEVLKDGRLVCGSSKGLSIKDYNGWRNILELRIEGSNSIANQYDYEYFIADTIAFDFGSSIADIEQGPDGLLYIGIDGTYPNFENPTRDGGGILIIDIDNPSEFTSIDTSILGFYGSSGNGYHVVKDLEFDVYGNLWVANAYVTNKNFPIHVRNNENIWKSFGTFETDVKISQSPISLAFDNWSRPWYGAFKSDAANLGVYPDGGIFNLNYSGSAVQTLSFSWNDIINNSTVWSIGFSGNRLYYLTPTGLNYFDIINGKNPVVGQNQYSYFPNISFGGGSKVKIDKQGNIWTSSTTQGIHVLLENTTYWPTINGLRQNNSPLLSDEIYDIDFDEERKLAYIATSKGISVLKIPFGKSYNNYDKIKIFPSPFRIDKHEFLIVDGLPFNASMKVMTLDGMVIRDLKSNGLSIDGDQLKWDGKNDSGELVASGVYLLSIIGSNGENTFEKITVIRK